MADRRVVAACSGQSGMAEREIVGLVAHGLDAAAHQHGDALHPGAHVLEDAALLPPLDDFWVGRKRLRTDPDLGARGVRREERAKADGCADCERVQFCTECISRFHPVSLPFPEGCRAESTITAEEARRRSCRADATTGGVTNMLSKTL